MQVMEVVNKTSFIAALGLLPNSRLSLIQHTITICMCAGWEITLISSFSCNMYYKVLWIGASTTRKKIRTRSSQLAVRSPINWHHIGECVDCRSAPRRHQTRLKSHSCCWKSSRKVPFFLSVCCSISVMCVFKVFKVSHDSEERLLLKLGHWSLNIGLGTRVYKITV